MLRLPGPLLLVFLLAALRSGAQQYDLRTLSLEQGLPSTGVNALCLDHEGFLWVGTMLGAARCDGSTFTAVAGTEGSEITALFSDRDGSMWLGTSNGDLLLWQYRTASIVHKAKSDAPITTFLAGKDALLWATDGDGVHTLDQKTGASVRVNDGLASLHVRSLVNDANGRVIAGTDSGLFELNGTTWHPLEANKGLPQLRVSALFADSMGILVGTDGGFAELDRDLHPLPLAQRFLGAFPIALPDVHATAILRAANGDIWMGTPSGLLHLSREGGLPTLRSIRSSNGLGHDQVRCLLEDRSGVIWIGTGFGGLSRFTSDAFLHFTDRDGLGSRTVTAIYRTPDHLLYIGTAGGGVACWNGREVKVLGASHGLTDPYVMTMGEDAQGFLLVGTNSQGLFRVRADRCEHVHTGLDIDASHIRSIQLDDEGRCWVGTDHGLYVGLAGDRYTKVEGIDHAVNRTCTDGDTLWAATAAGLYHFPIHASSWSATLDARTAALPLTSMVRDGQGNLWIGTEGRGVYRMHGSHVDSMNTAQGLASNTVEQVLLDALENVWIGTPRGIDMLELDVLQEQVIDVHHYGRDEGFIGIECFRNACMLDGDSALWFGTVRGATRYDPRKLIEDPHEPIVHLTDLKLFYESADWKPWSTGLDANGLPINLDLPYNKNHLTFSFTGISLAFPERVRYRYILEGHDPDWSPITATDRVTYSNLSPGDHVFKVMARNGSGVWTELPVSFPFTIEAPFWQTNTFRVGGGTALALGVFGLMRLRTRKLRKDREQLERLVLSRTRELVDEKQRSEELLLNILPEEVAKELKENGRAPAHRFEHCTVLFSDFKGFTTFSSNMDSDTLVSELHHYFGLFDKLCDAFGVEKIKTIGDAYMCAAGIPQPRASHAIDAVLMAFAMIDAVDKSNAERREKGLQEWPVRVGLHTGPVVAGVVGEKKFAYDIWGDTVNLASRMESNGEAGKVNISGPVYAQVMRYIEAAPRGPIKVKGKGEIQMYFAVRLKPEYSADAKGWIANDLLLDTVRGAIA